jgi:hypothetical protein
MQCKVKPAKDGRAFLRNCILENVFVINEALVGVTIKLICENSFSHLFDNLGIIIKAFDNRIAFPEPSSQLHVKSADLSVLFNLSLLENSLISFSPNLE